MVFKNIVLLHGWGASTEKLEPLGKELRNLKWKVFIPRLPGFEASPPKEVWGVGDYASFVLASANKFFKNKKFFIFGHSFGGRVAIKLVFNNPDRVSGMVLCSASGLSRTPLLKRVVFLIFAKMGKIFLIFPYFSSTWRKFLYKIARESDYEKAQGIMKEVFKRVVSEELKEELSAISHPTLVLWGEDDRMVPVSDAYLTKGILPESRLVLYENFGHTLPYDKPYELAKEIDKWAGQLK